MHRRPNTIEVVDNDEEKLTEVKKHSFGIVILYVQTFIGLVAAAVLTFITLPTVIDDTESAVLLGSAFLIFVFFIAGSVLMISTYIYRQNRLIVTDRNITQILQSGLFSRKVSQLNIVNVEDVTSVQNGLISTALNYGILRIETAGEQSNFEFLFCPNSGHVAKLILDAREKMLGQMDENESPIDVKTQSVRHRRGGTSKYGGNDSSQKKPTKKSTAKPKPKRKHKSQMHSVGARIVEHALDNKN